MEVCGGFKPGFGTGRGRLRAYMARRGIANVCLGAFMVPPPEFYSFHIQPVPASLEQARSTGCVVAASVAHVCEWRLWGPEYDWLAHTRPTATVGDSFWIYDPFEK